MGVENSVLNVREEVFYNGGELYKYTSVKPEQYNNSNLESTKGDIYSEYFNGTFEELTKKELPWFAVKTNLITGENRIKKYFITQQGVDALEIDYFDGEDISEYDICPDIDLVLSISKYVDDDDDVEIYFNVNSNENIKQISDYYGLPFPLKENNDLDINPNKWHNAAFDKACGLTRFQKRTKYNKSFIMSSIQFKNKTPKIFKVYKEYFT